MVTGYETYPLVEEGIEAFAAPTAIHLAQRPSSSVHQSNVGEICQKVSQCQLIELLANVCLPATCGRIPRALEEERRKGSRQHSLRDDVN